MRKTIVAASVALALVGNIATAAPIPTLPPHTGHCESATFDGVRLSYARNRFTVRGVNCMYAFLSATQYLDSFRAIDVALPGIERFRVGGPGWRAHWTCRSTDAGRNGIRFDCTSPGRGVGSSAKVAMRFLWTASLSATPCHRFTLPPITVGSEGSTGVSHVSATRNFGCNGIGQWIGNADFAIRTSGEPYRTVNSTGDYATVDRYYHYYDSGGQNSSNTPEDGPPYRCDVRTFTGPAWGPPDGESQWTCVGLWNLPPEIGWTELPSGAGA